MTPTQKAAHIGRWAETMTKWHIRRVKTRPKWQFVSFRGPAGGESFGVVDILAIRRDCRLRSDGTKRGDFLQIVLIQVKGGNAPNPTAQDADRLRVVRKRYHAYEVILATWKKGNAVKFYRLANRNGGGRDWRRCHAEDVFG